MSAEKQFPMLYRAEEYLKDEGYDLKSELRCHNLYEDCTGNLKRLFFDKKTKCWSVISTSRAHNQ